MKILVAFVSTYNILKSLIYIVRFFVCMYYIYIFNGAHVVPVGGACSLVSLLDRSEENRSPNGQSQPPIICVEPSSSRGKKSDREKIEPIKWISAISFLCSEISMRGSGMRVRGLARVRDGHADGCGYKFLWLNGHLQFCWIG